MITHLLLKTSGPAPRAACDGKSYKGRRARRADDKLSDYVGEVTCLACLRERIIDLRNILYLERKARTSS
jgi:hypothetical protein